MFLRALKKLAEYNKKKSLIHTFKRPKGSVKIYDKNTGKVLYDDKNVVVNGGREILSKLLGEALAANEITTLQAGTGTSPAEKTETSLVASVFSKAKTTQTYPTTESVKFAFSITDSEANGYTLAEFGLFTSGGDMFARTVTGGFPKTSAMALEIEWTITFL